MNLLTLLYRILKLASTTAGSEELSPASELYIPDVLKANEQEIESVIFQAYKEGYIDGVHAVEIDGLKKPKVLMSDSYIRLTIKGMEYASNNSSVKKIEKALKTVKDFVPGL